MDRRRYFREETLEPANAALVGHHHRLPLAAAFGTGTLASSDGQRFPVKGKSITARHAIICWTTEYQGLALTALRHCGRRIDDEVLAHIWPTHHENIHFDGTHTVDIAAELATLDANGYRPLRMPPADRG